MGWGQRVRASAQGEATSAENNDSARAHTLTMRYKLLSSVRMTTSVQSTIHSLRPDFALTTLPSFSSRRGPWYAVGSVRSMRLVSAAVSEERSDEAGCVPQRQDRVLPTTRDGMPTLHSLKRRQKRAQRHHRDRTGQRPYSPFPTNP